MPPTKSKRRTARPAVPPYVKLITALAMAGWRVVEIRPDSMSPDSKLWRVSAMRTDEVASMTVLHTGPDAALEELLRYVAADQEIQ